MGENRYDTMQHFCCRSPTVLTSKADSSCSETCTATHHSQPSRRSIVSRWWHSVSPPNLTLQYNSTANKEQS